MITRKATTVIVTLVLLGTTSLVAASPTTAHSDAECMRWNGGAGILWTFASQLQSKDCTARMGGVEDWYFLQASASGNQPLDVEVCPTNTDWDATLDVYWLPSGNILPTLAEPTKAYSGNQAFIDAFNGVLSPFNVASEDAGGFGGCESASLVPTGVQGRWYIRIDDTGTAAGADHYDRRVD